MEAVMAEYNAIAHPDFKPENSPVYRKWAGLPQELNDEAPGDPEIDSGAS